LVIQPNEGIDPCWACRTQRQVLTPAGYAERDCLLLRYRLPGLPHCYVMCHEPMAAPDVRGRADLLIFFIAQASRLALDDVGDDQAFALMHNGAAIRKRANWHLHLCVVRQRWQKAWVYTILPLKNLAVAVVPALGRS
jgi:hypothetical protein